MNYLVVVSAGQSTRLKAQINEKKQFHILPNGEMLFLASLKSCLQSGIFTKSYLVVGKEDTTKVQQILKDNNLSTTLVEGGKTRVYSVFNALLKIEEDNNITSKDVIFIHDGARPLVDKQTIFDLKEASLINHAVIPYTPVVSSLYDIEKDTYVSREKYYQIQTPQVFNLALLLSLFKQSDLDDPNFTDEGSILRHHGYKLKFIKGNISNIKVTDLDTLNLVEKIIKGQ